MLDADNVVRAIPVVVPGARINGVAKVAVVNVPLPGNGPENGPTVAFAWPCNVHAAALVVDPLNVPTFLCTFTIVAPVMFILNALIKMFDVELFTRLKNT